MMSTFTSTDRLMITTSYRVVARHDTDTSCLVHETNELVALTDAMPVSRNMRYALTNTLQQLDLTIGGDREVAQGL